MRRHRPDLLIAILTIVLMVVGMIVIYAIGPMRVNLLNIQFGKQLYQPDHFFRQQVIFVILSIVALFVAYKFPYELVSKFAKTVMLVGLGLCLLLAILQLTNSGMAKCELGGCRWLNFGGISLQPVEILKVGAVLYFSQLMAKAKREGTLEKLDFWLPFLIILGIMLFFVVVMQKDLGSSVPIMATAITILLIGGMKLKWWLAFLVGIGMMGMLVIAASPHRIERWLTFRGAEGSDQYHIENALIAIGTGGFGGVGIGNSVQATGYLPESINDSVFAVLGETFGLIGLVLIMGCFMWLFWRMIKMVEKLENDEQRMVVAGVLAWIATQVMVNMMAMTAMIPLTGITLPLLSYGGTSLITVTAMIGVVFQLSCYTRLKLVPKVYTEGRRMQR